MARLLRETFFPNSVNPELSKPRFDNLDNGPECGDAGSRPVPPGLHALPSTRRSGGVAGRRTQRLSMTEMKEKFFTSKPTADRRRVLKPRQKDPFPFTMQACVHSQLSHMNC